MLLKTSHAWSTIVYTCGRLFGNRERETGVEQNRSSNRPCVAKCTSHVLADRLRALFSGLSPQVGCRSAGIQAHRIHFFASLADVPVVTTRDHRAPFRVGNRRVLSHSVEFRVLRIAERSQNTLGAVALARRAFFTSASRGGDTCGAYRFDQVPRLCPARWFERLDQREKAAVQHPSANSTHRADTTPASDESAKSASLALSASMSTLSRCSRCPELSTLSKRDLFLYPSIGRYTHRFLAIWRSAPITKQL